MTVIQRSKILYKFGVILHALLSLGSIYFAFPILMNASNSLEANLGIPRFVIVMATLLAVAGLISTIGAWQEQKWGVWLTIIVRALDGILALPGVLAAPSFEAQLSATISVLAALFVIVVLLRPRHTS